MKDVKIESWEQYDEMAKVMEDFRSGELGKLITLIKKDLDDFFANNIVNMCTIKDYRISTGFNRHQFNIIPIDPYFEESYDDEESDKKIKEIGLNHGVQLGWEYYVYHK